MTRQRTVWLWALTFVVLASAAAAAGIVLGDDEPTSARLNVSSGENDAAPMPDEGSSSGSEEFVLRDPISELPPGVSHCRSSDIQFNSEADMGPGFLMFFNRSGRACGLADYPMVQGLDERGVWRPIPMVRSLGSSYTDGPEWTGSFDPRLTAVLSIREVVPGTDGSCVPQQGAPEKFSSARLLLSDDDAPITLPNVSLATGKCRPEILLWAYDSTDM